VNIIKSSEKNKRALWVADFGIRHNYGGAQRSDSILIDHGRALGWNILEYNYDVNPAILADTYDIIVSANLETLSRTNPQLIDFIASHPRHFRVEHDSNRYLPQERRKVLFGSACRNFFLTNYHLSQFISSYGDIFPNTAIVPDPIDVSMFKDTLKSRDNKVMYAGFMHDLKGTPAFIEYAMDNPQTSFVATSWGHRIYEFVLKKLDNVEFYGKMPFSDMPNIYNSHAEMFYHPMFYEPFCRSVGEAILCGMQINGNDKIGCLHYLNEVGMDRFREECANAPSTFWSIVNESL
tara:strand:+ start:259 stop:1137 length:879 start_codon:yes stop_codon:yes gene_type:complete